MKYRYVYLAHNGKRGTFTIKADSHEEAEKRAEKIRERHKNYLKEFYFSCEVEDNVPSGREALGVLIAIMGAELGKQQVNMSGGKMKPFTPNNIIADETVLRLVFTDNTSGR